MGVSVVGAERERWKGERKGQRVSGGNWSRKGGRNKEEVKAMGAEKW